MSAVALGSLGVDLVFSARTRYACYQEASVQSTTQEFLRRNARRTRAKADRPLAKPKSCLLSGRVAGSGGASLPSRPDQYDRK